MGFEIGSVSNFWELDANRDGRISVGESGDAVDTYDVDTNGLVEIWEYMQVVNEGSDRVLYKPAAITSWRLAYQNLKRFRAGILRGSTGVEVPAILEFLKTVAATSAWNDGWFSDKAYAALEKMVEAGIFLDYNFDQVEEFFEAIAKAGPKKAQAFEAAGNLAEAGLLDIIGVPNLAVVAGLAKGSSADVFLSFIEMKRRGLIERIGLPDIMKIVRSSGYSVAATLSAVIRMDEAGMIGSLINPRDLASFAVTAETNAGRLFDAFINMHQKGLLIKVSVYRALHISEDVGPQSCYLFDTLVNLQDEGLVRKYGLDRLIEFLSAIAKLSGSAVEKTCQEILELERSGLIKSFGFRRLIEIVNASGQYAEEAFKLLLALARRDYVEKLGASEIERLIVAVAEESGDRKGKAFLALIKLCDRGVFDRDGIIDRLVGAARRGRKWADKAFERM